MEVIFTIVVLIFSVVVHEVSHGFVAEHLGDSTARLAGRLTLNPLKHLDPFGSIILPLLLSLLPGGLIFGWAKPVPYNPMNLKRPERDGALIAAAGPTANLFIAFVFALAFRAVVNFIPSATPLTNLLAGVVVVNLMLAVFNLVPIPPLDGSKVLFGFLPPSARRQWESFERIGWLVLLIFIFFAIDLIAPVIRGLARLFLGA
ncbi:site-2 protease family protein [Candidatus Jorgensenbacteria bacterium CG23_combo_of_CG06-09_8_20_14_all_54_14]|uniref:Site-2 protease family protein n=1 Tax=Candidatus Jorgensenbacteria bacterium CG23_combo_of_CG06-09_8_20_14_all_54_14 TaxID=1974595 RepID=A0A2G9Z9E7_9BACT|nr:MAG: site-2 protease family protein [Candidatus Jorgensenbacteria bacterium CG23_combo_of_CG06-09_8_20_14_all_54_14]